MAEGGITGKGFRKGDPRINRNGRPKTFDALRTLAQKIAHEAAHKDGEPLVIDGHVVTVAEAILRSWAISKNPALQQKFIEVAFGKVPDKLDVTTNGKQLPALVEIKAIDYRTVLAPLAPGSMGDSDASGEGEGA